MFADSHCTSRQHWQTSSINIKTYHGGHIQQRTEANFSTLILRYPLDTSLLNMQLSSNALDLGIPAVANLEALAWDGSILMN